MRDEPQCAEGMEDGVMYERHDSKSRVKGEECYGAVAAARNSNSIGEFYT